jgi:hypothetical protein
VGRRQAGHSVISSCVSAEGLRNPGGEDAEEAILEIPKTAALSLEGLSLPSDAECALELTAR